MVAKKPAIPERKARLINVSGKPPAQRKPTPNSTKGRAKDVVAHPGGTIRMYRRLPFGEAAVDQVACRLAEQMGREPASISAALRSAVDAANAGAMDRVNDFNRADIRGRTEDALAVVTPLAAAFSAPDLRERLLMVLDIFDHDSHRKGRDLFDLLAMAQVVARMEKSLTAAARSSKPRPKQQNLGNPYQKALIGLLVMFWRDYVGVLPSKKPASVNTASLRGMFWDFAVASLIDLHIPDKNLAFAHYVRDAVDCLERGEQPKMLDVDPARAEALERLLGVRPIK